MTGWKSYVQSLHAKTILINAFVQKLDTDIDMSIFDNRIFKNMEAQKYCVLPRDIFVFTVSVSALFL